MGAGLVKLGFSTWTKPGLPIDTSVRELAPSASRGVEITVIPLVLDRARHPGGRRAPSHPLSVHTHVKDERCRIPGEGEFDYVQYLREMRKAGYNGFITAEISMQVQRPPAYDPLAAAAMTYRTLDAAFREAGIWSQDCLAVPLSR